MQKYDIPFLTPYVKICKGLIMILKLIFPEESRGENLCDIRLGNLFLRYDTKSMIYKIYKITNKFHYKN